MEMGAEYRSDWSPDCTLLVCAFPNTPKFKQVVTDCGTIVSKEWISECYKQKKLVEIDCFLMHAGKPWRKLKNSSLQVSPDQENALCGKRPKAVHGVPPPSSSGSSVFKEKASESHKLPFSSSKVQEWASLDFNSTISWLQSQEEKPEPRELKRIAAEGILTCLEDAIDALKDKTDVARVIERWSSVPLVVKELAKLESKKIGTNALSREEILEQAVVCKSIYEKELHHLEMLPMSDEKHEDDDEKTELMTDDGGADSDETIEMPEDEVDQALKDIVSRQ
ncbi:DNA-repair protein XRCC1 isoform X2 [Amborella trichopoda]|nr:DNA-repair protein XRCC1 isoform X2 [Amborella trichopoda]|eukprot:XP_020522891.1 DNA-repair protein XRCC1 isoform X2 [Amborella trichopoda]